MGEYLLGTGDDELARLEFQQGVWADVTARFLERVGLAPGMRVLDLGCGPGFVTRVLREGVGEGGHVVALDESEHWRDVLQAECDRRRWSNVEVRCERIEEADLGPEAFDLVFSRWVFSFLPDPGAALRAVARALVPGGVLALQDYNHEGISIFPRSRGFEAVVRATREWFARAGGDTWIVGRLPRLLREAGLERTELTPNVLAGGPESPAMEWVGSFLVFFSRAYLEQGLVTQAEFDAFHAEWQARRRDPDTLFFSPIVCDVAARRPGPDAS